MLIRPAIESDFHAIAALTNRYISGTATHFGYAPVTADELRDSWSAVRDRYPFLVAEHADSPVSSSFAGYAKAYRWRERDAYAWTAEVGIYIEPALHGKGVGKSLYAALIERCRQCGFHTLVAGITLPNEVSVKLHESCGFRPVGTFREVGWKLEAWHCVGFYQLALGPTTAAARKLTSPAV